MPIYEYECTDCGRTSEQMQKVSDPPLSSCPACGASSLRKLISRSSFHLKGSGWYVTDYKRKAEKGTNEKTSASVKEGQSATKSSETKSSTSKESSTSGKSKTGGSKTSD